MTTTALVPVFTGDLAGQPTPLCNARDLHATLAVGRDFTNWIKGRIEEYGFTEGEDFIIDSPKRANQSGRGGDRRSRDYHLTIDMAKELAMIENNDRGRAVRRYFIECERRAKPGANALTAQPVPQARAEFDLRTAMLEDNSAPTVPLPADVQAAINRKAWVLAHDAYELCREHLARRVAYRCEFGHPERRLDHKTALAVIAETTLDMALAPRHYNALAALVRATEAVAGQANDTLTKMREELKGLTK